MKKLEVREGMKKSEIHHFSLFEFNNKLSGLEEIIR